MSIFLLTAAFMALTHVSEQQRKLLAHLTQDTVVERPCVLVTGVPEVDCQDPVPGRRWDVSGDPDAPPHIDPSVMRRTTVADVTHVVPETVYSYAHAPSTPVILGVETAPVVPGYITVKNSSAAGGSMGFLAAGDASAVLNLEDSVTTHNDFGLVASNGATLRASRVSIFSNRVNGQFNDGTAHLVSFGNNYLVGNTSNGVFTLGVPPQ